MKKIFYMIAMAAAFVLSSCGNEDPQEGGKLSVSVTPGEASVNELTFAVTSESAFACAWMCVEDGTAVPSGMDILSNGKAVFANTTDEAKATGLKDNTTYVIVAAAMDENDNVVTSAPVKMTTQVRPLEPAVTATIVEIKGSSVSFTITPTDAEECAYKVYAKGESSTASDVLSTGTEVAADLASEVTVNNLADGEYYFVAAVQGGDTKAISSQVAFIINTSAPTYSINPTRVYEYYAHNGYGNGKEYVVRFEFIDNVGETSQIVLDFIQPNSCDYLPEGTYELSADAEYRLDPGYTYQSIKGEGDAEYVSGHVTVIIKDGQYIFDIKLQRSEDEKTYSGHMLSMTWTGTVEYMPIV